MSSNGLKAGPFSDIYIGVYGASAVLTKIQDVTTDEFVIEPYFETEYLVVEDNDVQSGFHGSKFTITFYGDSTEITNLGKGQTPYASKNAVPSTYQYSLLLVYPDAAAESSYYFPKIRTVKTYRVNYGKKAGTATVISFIATARSAATLSEYKDTQAALATIMSTRSPF
jgi:hypothetical protein